MFKYQYCKIFRFKLQYNFYWHSSLSNYLEKNYKKQIIFNINLLLKCGCYSRTIALDLFNAE